MTQNGLGWGQVLKTRGQSGPRDAGRTPCVAEAETGGMGLESLSVSTAGHPRRAAERHGTDAPQSLHTAPSQTQPADILSHLSPLHRRIHASGF